MSKRGPGANWGGDEERFGGPPPGMDNVDRPTQATAAQMARRKIMAPKKSSQNRDRSNSPAVGAQVSSTFGMQTQQQQPAANPFTKPNYTFTFGEPQQQQQPNGNSTQSSFVFGSNTPAPSNQSQQNGNATLFSQSSAPSFGSNSTAQPQQNGFTSTTSIFSNQTSQQSSNGGFGAFGQTQSTQQNGTSTPATSFGAGFGGETRNSMQQNGSGSNMFPGLNFNKPAETTEISSTPNIFGGAFGQQAQQNGDKAASPFPIFGQQNTQTEREKSATPHSGFRQNNTASEREKSATPFSALGQQNAPAQQSKASTPIPSFGQPNTLDQQQKPNTLFSGFGQQSQKENGEKSTSLFSAFGSKTAESSNKQANGFGFGLTPAEKTDKSSTSLGQQAAAPATAASNTASNLFGGFGQSQPAGNSSKSLFASSQPLKEAPKLGGSLFAQPSTSITSGTGLFGSKVTADAPAKSTGSIFDQLPKQDSSASKFVFDSSDPSQVYKEGDDEGEDAHEDAQQNGDTASTVQAAKTNLFATFGQPQSTPQAAKPAPNLFAQAQGSTSLFKPSASQVDTSMVTPGSTPQKSLFQNNTSNETSAASATPAAQPPRSLFSRIDQDDVNKRLGQQADETPKASMAGTAAAPAATAKPTFTPSSFSGGGPSLTQKPQPAAPASTNLFAKSTAAAPPATPATPAPTFQAPPATAPVARVNAAPATATASRSYTAAVSTNLSPAQQKSFKEFNEGLLNHLKTQDASKDWSAIYRYALVAAAEIAGRTVPSEEETYPVPPAPTQSSSVTAPAIAQTPRAAPVANVFSDPPATAPANKKRHFAEYGEDEHRAPATEKRIKPNELTQYPKLPESASNTAKLFASTLEEPDYEPDYSHLMQGLPKPTTMYSPTAPPYMYKDKPPNNSLFSASTASTAATPSASGLKPSFGAAATTPSTSSTAAPPPVAGFKPSFGAAATTPSIVSASAASSVGGFKPSFGAAANTPSTQAPTGGFKPNGGAATGADNFLSSFGSLAKKTEEEERKKRKAEDYDSDEETEEQWEQRDRAEQEAKRAKFEEAAKGASGFSLKPATAVSAEQNQGSGDKTWNPDTPIKFNSGAAASTAATTTPAGAPPKFNLFSASSTVKATSKLAHSEVSTPPDAADTPAPCAIAASTDGQAAAAGDEAAAEGEPSDEQHDAPAEDMNGLQPAEREANEILAELPGVKTQINEHDEEKGKKVWKPKTEGNIYLLKDKATGKTRMLCRAGAGRIVLNHNPNKGATFTQHSKKATLVVAGLLYDHLHTNPPGLAQWIFTFQNAEDAATFVRIMTEGTPK